MVVLAYVEKNDVKGRGALFPYKRSGGVESRNKFFFGQLGYIKTPSRAFYETSWRRRKANAETLGSSGAAIGRGRYEEKGGGQQVTSLFPESADNEKLKAIYGNFGLWSWLRYWFIDSENITTLMLMDKGYYDYDYSEPKDHKTPTKKKRTHEQMQAMLTRMGFGELKKTGFSQPANAEELQNIAMAELNIKKNKSK